MMENTKNFWRSLGVATLTAIITVVSLFVVADLVGSEDVEKHINENTEQLIDVSEKTREVVCLVVLRVADDYPEKVAQRIHELCDEVA